MTGETTGTSDKSVDEIITAMGHGKLPFATVQGYIFPFINVSSVQDTRSANFGCMQKIGGSSSSVELAVTNIAIAGTSVTIEQNVYELKLVS